MHSNPDSTHGKRIRGNRDFYEGWLLPKIRWVRNRIHDTRHYCTLNCRACAVLFSSACAGREVLRSFINTAQTIVFWLQHMRLHSLYLSLHCDTQATVSEEELATAYYQQSGHLYSWGTTYGDADVQQNRDSTNRQNQSKCLTEPFTRNMWNPPHPLLCLTLTHRDLPLSYVTIHFLLLRLQPSRWLKGWSTYYMTHHMCPCYKPHSRSLFSYHRYFKLLLSVTKETLR